MVEFWSFFQCETGLKPGFAPGKKMHHHLLRMHGPSKKKKKKGARKGESFTKGHLKCKWLGHLLHLSQNQRIVSVDRDL